ncbi:MAG: hypothetical protein ACQEP6_00615 [Patescibacteria group bacterium]
MEKKKKSSHLIEDFIKQNKLDCQELFRNHEPLDGSVFIDLLEENSAYWLHDGDMIKPHPGTPTGNCSEGRIDCSLVLNKPLLSEFLAMQLKLKIMEAMKLKDSQEQRIDWVITSRYEGITFAHDVARMFDAKSGFTEKDLLAENGMRWKRWVISPHENVLQVEAQITSGDNLLGARAAIDRDNLYPVNWIPYVGVFVHRPLVLPNDPYDERVLVPLLEVEIQEWQRNACPLCMHGSPRVRSKDEISFLKI